MGQVNFDTDIEKNVNINKTVFLDVFKTVDADVDIQGRLATAEASADALGAAGNGTGDPITLFLLDDFDSEQLIPADPSPPPPDAMNPNSGCVDLLPTESDFPDGTERCVTVNVTSGTGTSVFESGAGSLADFSNPSGNAAVFSLLYDLTSTTDVLNGANEATAFLHISEAGSDLGEELDITFIDSDGTSATVTLMIDPGTSMDPETFEVPLSNWQAVASGGADDFLDFTAIDEFRLEISDETEADTFLDLVEIKDFAPGGGGTLAETDTFAQVDDSGAFAFSESLAAFDPGNNNDFFLA